MLLTWSPHGKSSAQAAIDYLTGPEVWKLIAGRQHLVIRDPAPEVLLGDLNLVARYTDVLPFRCRYAVATLSLSSDDICVERFRCGVQDVRDDLHAAARLCIEFAFSGIPNRARPPVLVSAQTHTGRAEVSVVFPRAVGVPGSRLHAWNPHPPTSASRADWDAIVDVINDHFGWADPRDPMRRQWLSAPDWMVAETAEILRARRAEVSARFDLGAPWYQAWRLCRTAARETHGDRAGIVARLNAGLAAYGWTVTSESRRGITCGPLHGEGRHVTFTGAVLRGGEDDAVDPFDAMVARQTEIMKAPKRLEDAIARRWVSNRSLGTWTWIDPPTPANILAGPSRSLPPRERLARLLDRMLMRAQLAVQSICLVDELLKIPTGALRAIAIKLENLNERHNPRPASPVSDRDADRPSAPHVGSGRSSLGGSARPVLDGDLPDRTRNDVSSREPDGGSSEDRGRPVPLRLGAGRGARRILAGGVDRPPARAGAKAGSAISTAGWSRGQWLREVGRLVWAKLGDHSLAWRTDAGDVEGIMVHVSAREIWVPIARSHPNAKWQADIERRLSQNAEDGRYDDMGFTI